MQALDRHLDPKKAEKREKSIFLVTAHREEDNLLLATEMGVSERTSAVWKDLTLARDLPLLVTKYSSLPFRTRLEWVQTPYNVQPPVQSIYNS